MSVLFAQGLELLVYGMGTVVVFLALLVMATRVMSRVVLRHFPEPEPVIVPRRQPSPHAGGDVTEPTPELLAAISAAVHLHRQRRAAARETARDPQQQ